MADERPWGWGICCLCGRDCEDESDYDAERQVSMHKACLAQQCQNSEERQAQEVFARR